jgi:hypothetical protein
MADIGKNLCEHLKALSKKLEVTVTLRDPNGHSEKGTLASVGEDFLELNRAGMTNCTIVPFCAIAKIDFQA